MEVSKNLGKVEKFYSNKLWSLNMVRNAVGRWITESEYLLITGENYTPA